MKKIAISLIFLGVLTGCANSGGMRASNCDNNSPNYIGAGLGAATGGLLGSLIGGGTGQIIAVGAGAATGAVVGSQAKLGC